MALDKSMTDPIISTYRGFIADLESKSFTGENYNKLVEIVNYLEQMTNEYSGMEGFIEFNNRVMTENIYGKIGDFYSRALNESSGSSSSDTPYDDADLMKMSIDGLERAIQTNKKDYEDQLNQAKTPEDKLEIELTRGTIVEKTIQAIQTIIDLGNEAGMTYPKFLSTQLKKGLYDSLVTILSRETFEEIYNRSVFMMSIPPLIKKNKTKLDKYNELSKNAKLGNPVPQEWTICDESIDKNFAAEENQWKHIERCFTNIFYDLINWGDSFCKYAPNIEPWKLIFPESEKIKKIIFCQKTSPGIIIEKINLMKHFFNIDFYQIFNHEVFTYLVESDIIDYSQELIELIAFDVFPQCKVGNKLSNETISKFENCFNGNRRLNPNYFRPSQRIRDYYNNKFGEGYFEKKHGTFSINTKINSAPWDLNTFKYR